MDDLENLSKMGRNEVELNLTNLPLFPMLSNIVSDMEILAVQEGLSLTLSCPPDVTLYADPDRLRRIVINLVDNAIKFTPRGGKVSVSVEVKEKNVDISVTDTGIGIPAESQVDIFEKFYKENEKSRGLGLGLALVKALVELHGGDISLESKVGKGSRFTVTLKRA